MIVSLVAVLWVVGWLGTLVYVKPMIRRRRERIEIAAAHERIAELENNLGIGRDTFERRFEEAVGPQFSSLGDAYPLALLEAWQRAQLRTAVHPSEVEIWHAPDYPPLRVKPGWIKAFEEAQQASANLVPDALPFYPHPPVRDNMPVRRH